MFVFLSDNGASLEGQEHGIINEYAMYNALFPEFSELLEHIDRIGGPGYMNHYPRGWSMAGNTPFREWKRSVWQGGIADPFIIRWPNRIRTAGEIRGQYHHVTDVMPTILEALDIEPPSRIDGVPQSEIEGVSMWYSVLDPDADSRKRVQYYEMLGHRAIYYDGWKAVADHAPMSSRGNFDQDRWFLYNMADDPNETTDLSGKHPEVVQDLVDRWWVEAGRYNVLPVDDRGHERWPDPRPSVGPDRDTFEYLPNTQPIFARGAVNTLNRDFDIVTTISPCPSGVTEGVIFAHGNRFGGYTLFVKDGEVRFVYNLCGLREYRVTAPLPAEDGPIRVSVVYTREADHRGNVRLIVGEAEPVKGRIGMTIPWVFPAHSSLNCGLDRGLSVCPDYEAPFAFTGEIDRVSVTVGEQGTLDKAKILEAALAEQ